MHDAMIKAIYDETEDRRAINIKNSADWISVEHQPGDRALLIQIGPLNTEGAHNFDLRFVEDLNLSEHDDYVRGTVFFDGKNYFSLAVKGSFYSENKIKEFVNKLIVNSEDDSFLGICKHLSYYMIWEYKDYKDV
jgi:hypothetical protein